MKIVIFLALLSGLAIFNVSALSINRAKGQYVHLNSNRNQDGMKLRDIEVPKPVFQRNLDRVSEAEPADVVARMASENRAEPLVPGTQDRYPLVAYGEPIVNVASGDRYAYVRAPAAGRSQNRGGVTQMKATMNRQPVEHGRIHEERQVDPYENGRKVSVLG